jgi:hypothetical protein
VAKQLTVDQLREKAAQGLALNAEAQAAVEADDARRAEEQREAAKAKRITEFLDLEPGLRADAEGAQSERDRIGAVGDPDGALHAEVLRGLLLEGPVVRAADEALALQHLAERSLEPRDQRLVFGSDVNEGNRLHAGQL